MVVGRRINFGSAIFAGFAAAYIMYFADKWLAGTLGLFGMFPGTDNAWWMLEHHIDGILLAFLFVWPWLYSRLPGAGWLKGLIFGLIWTIVYMIVSLIAGALGAKMFQGMPMTASIIFSSLILHLIWGFFLGLFYSPPEGLERVAENPTTR